MLYSVAKMEALQTLRIDPKRVTSKATSKVFNLFNHQKCVFYSRNPPPSPPLPFSIHFQVGKLGKADNPPDLWIHHDQMEMKGMDKSQRSNSVNTVSPVMRRSQDLDSLDGMPSSSTAGRPSNPTDSLDRRVGYVTTYAGSPDISNSPVTIPSRACACFSLVSSLPYN